MDKPINSRNQLILFGVPFLIITSMILITKSSMFDSNPNSLSIGIIFDLLITTPFVYFLLIRKTKIPKTTIIPVLFIGLVVGTIIIPTENQYFLSLFKIWVLPLIELSVISYVLYTLRKTIKEYKKQAILSIDFFTTLKEACSKILPKKIVMPVVTEIAVFYYGFIHWKKKIPNKNEYTYHNDSGTITLFIALLFIICIEMLVLHLLLVKWSPIVAWGLTIFSIYSTIQIFGFMRAFSKRFISIENNMLMLRYGILSESRIKLSEIKSVEISFKDIELNKETRTLSPLGELESHNIIIRLNKENTLIGFYGIKKKYKTIIFFVDDKEKFKLQIEKHIIK